MPNHNENKLPSESIIVNASDVASIYASLEEILPSLDFLYMRAYDEETLHTIQYVIHTILQCSDKLIEMQMIEIDPDEIDYF
jgi:hypothetical protein